MAETAFSAIGNRISSALVIGYPDQIASWSAPPHCSVLPADHPLPTQRNIIAANRVRDFVADRSNPDPILALISGGGSSMLTSPAPGISLDDIRTLSNALMRAGATIEELNAVRKHIDTIKGGRLGLAANGLRVDAALLSDVIGDRIDTIASGPFAPDPTTISDALTILQRTGLLGLVPSVTAHLEHGHHTGIGETPKPGCPELASISHSILAGNTSAATAADHALRGLHLNTAVRTGWTGESDELAKELVASLVGPNSAAVIAGEPTVSNVAPDARGGPVQQAVLAAAILLEKLAGDWLVCGVATDGIDGPTDAAGAAMDQTSFHTARALGLDPQQCLHEHQSYPLFKAIKTHIQTGPTGTNINDVLFAIRW